jgi:hypothetical protein
MAAGNALYRQIMIGFLDTHWGLPPASFPQRIYSLEGFLSSVGLDLLFPG